MPRWLMRRSWVGGCTMLLACLVVFGIAACAHAEAENQHAKKYLVMVSTSLPSGDVVEVEKECDLAHPKEKAELDELFREDKVVSLQEERPTNILAISWDLGLWTIVVFGLLLYVLRKLAWKPWLEATQRREQNILQARAEAQQARDEAQRLRDPLQSEM